MQSYLLLASLLSLAPSALSAPAAAPDSGFGSGSNPICVDGKKYVIHKQNGPFNGPPRLVAGERCTANEAGCSISDSKSYGVTITVTTGFDLGLDFGEIAHAGISASVSVGTSTTESITTTQTCPKFCTCGLQATPQLYHVEGDQLHYPHNLGGPDSDCVGAEGVNGPYAADLPVLIPGAAANNQAVVTFSACRVAHTFCLADPGLPLCPTS